MVSGYAVDGSTGKVVYQWDYDASDPTPQTKQQMESTDPHADGLPSEDFCLEVDCSRFKPLFVAPGNRVPANADPKEYFCGILNTAAIRNADSTTAIGELWVEYVCELQIPVAPSSGTPATIKNPVNFMTFSYASTGLPSGTQEILTLNSASSGLVNATANTQFTPIFTIASNSLVCNLTGFYRYKCTFAISNGGINISSYTVGLVNNTTGITLSSVVNSGSDTVSVSTLVLDCVFIMTAGQSLSATGYVISAGGTTVILSAGSQTLSSTDGYLQLLS
jgi:hypothetical protein